MINLVLLFVFYASALSELNADSQSAGIISDTELALAIERRESGLNGKVVQFMETVYSGSDIETPIDSKDLTRENLFYKILWTVAFQDGRYRIERIWLDGEQTFVNSVGLEELYTWDGMIGRRLSKNLPVGILEHIDITSTMQAEIRREPALDWLGWQLCDAPYPTSFSSLLSSCEQEPEEVTGQRTRWSMSAPFSSDVEYEVIAARENGRIEIKDLFIRYYIKEFEGKNLIRLLASTRQIILGKVDEGCDLSRSVTILKTRLPTALLDGQWILHQISLVDVSEISIDDEKLLVPFDQGTEVWDDRYLISYRIGENSLAIDGRALITSDPLVGEVGSQLAHLVETGVYADQIVGLVVNPNISQKKPYIGRIVFSALCIFGIVYVLMRKGS